MKTVRSIGLCSIIIVVLFSLIGQASPAKAAGLNYTFSIRDTGKAEIASQQTHSAPTAVKLSTIDGNSDYAGVRFTFSPGQLKFKDLTELSYWEYVDARGNEVSVDIFPDIWLDLN